MFGIPTGLATRKQAPEAERLRTVQLLVAVERLNEITPPKNTRWREAVQFFVRGANVHQHIPARHSLKSNLNNVIGRFMPSRTLKNADFRAS